MTSQSCKVNLFASEEQFPNLPAPSRWLSIPKAAFGGCMAKLPERRPTDTVTDKLLVFEDTNGDGKADKVTPSWTD